MDGILAIEHNHQALRRILGGIVAMAGLAGVGVANTLPRHLYLAVLRLLRPAEAAARRLIIALALAVPPQARDGKTLDVTLPPQRPRKPTRKSAILRNGVGTGIILPHGLRGTAHFFAQNGAAGSGPDVDGGKVAVRRLSLPLLDPLPNPFRRRRIAADSVPRICMPGFTARFPVRQPPSPNDPIDATRLGQRLAALAAALDDMPAQARRFARWKARRDAKLVRRVWPLRMGRPPGGRLSRYDPSAGRRRNIREVDEVLAHAHALAFYALEQPDTS